ncbi:hypothetical protein HDU91_001701, partial [Kappamyces sp. JEL0680]
LCLITWRDCLFGPMHQRILASLLHQIHRERKGERIDAILLEQTIKSFGIDASDFKKTSLTLYVENFEVDFLGETEQMYRQNSLSHLSDHAVTDYLKKAQSWLQDEEDRVKRYLHATTQKPLMALTEAVLLTAHARIIQDQFKPLIERGKLDDLERMYLLLSRVPDTLVVLRDMLEDHVQEQGVIAVRKIAQSQAGSADNDSGSLPAPRSRTGSAGDKKADRTEKPELDPKAYCDALLGTYTTYANITNTIFQGEAGFIASLDKACREFINRNVLCPNGSSRSAELLAKYADLLLRKSSKSNEDAEMEALLSGVMTIFKFLEDKDVFQKFYSKHLAKRLVNGASASDDAEASMIGKLKEACGYEYTSKLQRMFTDMSISRDLNSGFRYGAGLTGSDQMELTHGKQDMDFSILVLGSGSWPLSPPTTPFTIPADLLPSYERFAGYYQSKHQGRKLTWLVQLSKGDIKANYGPSRPSYTFQVSTYQIGILLAYNDATSHTLAELAAITGMAHDALLGNVNLLCKAKVLVEEAGEGPRYAVNLDFKSKKIRMNLNIAIKSEAKAE